MSEKISPYSRTVYFYETDKMGVVHHANYIRIMEEARMDFMKKIAVPYPSIEQMGIVVPVTKVDCSYLQPLYFDERILVYVNLKMFNGVRAVYSYEIYAEPDRLCARAESSHCFIKEETNMPVHMKRAFPDMYEQVIKLVKE